MTLPIIHVASVALINSENHILIAKRPSNKSMSSLWEFPGGKIEPNESPEQCLTRELKEELNILVSACTLKEYTFTSYTYNNFHLVMYLYICTEWQNTPEGKEGQELKWIAAEILNTVAMPEANKNLVKKLQTFTKTNINA